MSTKYLLFVDDREDQRVSFKDAVSDWNDANAANGRSFHYEIRDTYAGGIEALGRYRFDGALFDLRLPSPEAGHPDAPLGNALADEALNRHGIPVAIITALDTELDPAFTPTDTMTVFNKGDADVWQRAVEWFGQKWAMMDVLAASRAHIRSISAEVFAGRVWPRWSDYVNAAGAETAELAPIVTRQFVWHMGEVLGLGGETNALWHPFENWICPPLNQARANTGDVFELDGQLWIVLSAPCDMAADDKITDVLLAKCDRDALPEWNDRIDKLRKAENEDQRKKFGGWFRSLVNQSTVSTHFLPPLPDDPRPIAVMFSSLTTKPLGYLMENLNLRKASVSAPFLTNMTQRFGSYISRVGQPNLDVNRFA